MTKTQLASRCMVDANSDRQGIIASEFISWKPPTPAKCFSITCQTSCRIMESSAWQAVRERRGMKRQREKINGDRERGRCSGTSKQGSRGEKQNRGNRCSCAAISLPALETLRWIMWTRGSIEVYPALSKTAGRLVEQASRRKTNTTLSQMSILCAYVSFERQMFLSVGPRLMELHMKHMLED